MEIYVILSTEDAATEQIPTVQGGKEFSYFIYEARQALSPLFSTSKELQHEVLRVADRLEIEWRQVLTDLKLYNPCNN